MRRLERATRLVLDTNVVLDCFGFADPSSRPIVAQLDGHRAELLSSAALRAELERVLAYPALPFDDRLRAQILERYDELARPVTDNAARPPLPRCRDEDDQKFLEAASDGAADFLITKDKALLRLAREMNARKRFAILTPLDYGTRGD
jgi:putative PIN family toxin of toxin-antitoxin system